MLVFLFMFSFGSSKALIAQCEIGAIEATPTPCDSNGYFDLIINFEHANVGSQGFQVEGMGGLWGTFEYVDLPIILYDLEGDGTTFYEFVIRDVEFPDCHNSVEVGVIDCDGGPCLIWNVDIFPQDCEGGFFYVHLAFWHENTGTEGFRVQGNGNNYGNFEYDDLPIIIGPLEGDGVTEYEFVVIDNEFENCSDWAAIDPVDCPGGECDIWDLVVDDHPCVEGMFNVYLNFFYENVSDAGFELYINYDLYESYSYDDLPLENIGPFAGDGSTVYHFLVVDKENENCAEDLNFGPIDCGTTGDCNIWDVYADASPCDELGHFYVHIDFEFENVGNEGFRIQGNGMNYGNYNYDSIPIIIGPLLGDGTTVYEFVVIDNQLEDCSDWTAIDPIDCNPPGGDCEIGELQTTILPCNQNNEFYVLLDFDYANTSDGFSVVGNGASYGNFLYTNLPVDIGPLMGDGLTVYEFLVQDDVHDNCAEDTYIDPVSCDSTTQMMNFTTQVVSCDNEMYQLQMNFDVVNPGEFGFKIIGNGQEYGSFSYDHLPVTIGPLETDGSTPYHFIAKDRQHTDYGNWDKLIPFTCESLGISDKTFDETIKVYPNPSYGNIVFENTSGNTVHAVLYNSSGSEIKSFSFKTSYQMDALESGIYYYRINGKDGKVSSGKLIVR